MTTNDITDPYRLTGSRRWPAPGLYAVTLPDGERTLASFRVYDATTIPGKTYWHRGDDVPLTDVVPVTPVPTAALDALRAAFDAPPTPTGTSPARAALNLLHATDALNEGDQS